MASAGVTNPKSKDGIIWWNMHIPAQRWTDECPDFLAAVDDADRATLATYDEDFRVMSWGEVYEIIETNRLQSFKRWPSDLRRYRDYVAQIRREYGDLVAFMLSVRLHWDNPCPKGQPFEFEDDYKILLNDWPYGIDPKIKHLVVWTKFVLEEDPTTGDLTSGARRQIDKFVRKTFIREEEESAEHVAWFRNWAALKSVHAVEHIHVMLYDPDPDFVKTITAGDIATADLTRKDVPT